MRASWRSGIVRAASCSLRRADRALRGVARPGWSSVTRTACSSPAASRSTPASRPAIASRTARLISSSGHAEPARLLVVDAHREVELRLPQRVVHVARARRREQQILDLASEHRAAARAPRPKTRICDRRSRAAGRLELRARGSSRSGRRRARARSASSTRGVAYGSTRASCTKSSPMLVFSPSGARCSRSAGCRGPTFATTRVDLGMLREHGLGEAQRRASVAASDAPSGALDLERGTAGCRPSGRARSPMTRHQRERADEEQRGAGERRRAAARARSAAAGGSSTR